MAKRICTTPDCNKPMTYGRLGLCVMHYNRLRNHGSLDDPRPSLEERFWSKVDKDGPLSENCPELGPCWLWTRAKRPLGYGVFVLNGRLDGAHRVAYELTVGPIPEGLELDHLCRRPACVRPDHLRPVTHQENSLRGYSPMAQQARQTHCIRGHELTEANVYRRPGNPNKRECRTCMAERARRRDDGQPRSRPRPARASQHLA